MSQNNIKNTAFMGIFLLTFLGFLYYILVFYVVGLRYRPQISTTRKCPDLQLHRRNKFGYGDLTEEFEARASDFWPSTDVLKAIESDGYTPVALSMNILSKNIPKQTENTSAENQKATFPDGLNNATHDGVDASMNVSSTLTFLVPNVVHYIAFGTDLNFTFVNYLSYLSVERFIQPEYIFLHGDSIPNGPWWNLTLHNVRNIYHVKRKFSQRSPNGKVFKYPAHISDYLRTEIMLRKYFIKYICLLLLLLLSSGVERWGRMGRTARVTPSEGVTPRPKRKK